MDANELRAAIKQLELFNEKVEELGKSSFAEAIFAPDSGVSFTAEMGKAVTAERRGPSDESIRAWAPSIRQLISVKDRISFQQMHLLYPKLPIDTSQLDALKTLRLNLEGFLDGPANQHTEMRIEPLKINAQEPDVRTFIEQFIYGDIMHTDEDKRDNYINWRSNKLIFAFAQNRFCVLGAHIINFATELMEYNIWVLPKLKALQ